MMKRWEIKMRRGTEKDKMREREKKRATDTAREVEKETWKGGDEERNDGEITKVNVKVRKKIGPWNGCGVRGLCVCEGRQALV